MLPFFPTTPFFVANFPVAQFSVALFTVAVISVNLFRSWSVDSGTSQHIEKVAGDASSMKLNSIVSA